MNRREALINTARLLTLSGLAALGTLLYGKRGHPCAERPSCNGCATLNTCGSPYATTQKETMADGQE